MSYFARFRQPYASTRRAETRSSLAAAPRRSWVRVRMSCASSSARLGSGGAGASRERRELAPRVSKRGWGEWIGGGPPISRSGTGSRSAIPPITTCASTHRGSTRRNVPRSSWRRCERAARDLLRHGEFTSARVDPHRASLPGLPAAVARAPRLEPRYVDAVYRHGILRSAHGGFA